MSDETGWSKWTPVEGDAADYDAEPVTDWEPVPPPTKKKPGSSFMADDEVTVYDCEKTESSTLVARLYTNESGRRVDIRDFYRNKAGELKPTRRGVPINVDDLPELEKAVAALLARSEEESK